MNELRARSTVNAIDNGNGDALYTVGQKSEAKNSWSSFCQIVTDLQKFFFLRLFAVSWPGAQSARGQPRSCL